VRHYVENEWALTLSDIIMRRTSWHYYHPGMPARAPEIARWMSAAAGWPPGQLDKELAAYQAEAAKTYPASQTPNPQPA
jgi:glycerol-3-phosphate dehydrogenase